MIHKIRRHLTGALRRLLPPAQVRVGPVTILIDRRLMPKSLIRAILRGDYEQPERIAVERMLRPGDSVVEFGGGVGLVTMIAAEIVGPDRVHVFEPQSVACDLIRQNAKLNGLDIKCSNMAVARHSGTRKFWATSNIISSNLFGGRRDGKGEAFAIEVETVAIEEILEAYRPNVLIVDIEGAEVEVLRDCDLGGIEVIVIEMHPHVVGGDQIAALQAHFRAQGLAPITVLESGHTQVFARGRQPLI